MKEMQTITLPLVLLIGLIGGSILHIEITNAQSQSLTQAQTTTPVPVVDPAKGGHIGANGIREELLTGDNAEKARTAALNAVPGSTIERVETDAEGSSYEAHVLKSDGSRVTVKFDSNFNVTNIESGFQKPAKSE